MIVLEKCSSHCSGTFLVVEDEPAEADIIVVLMGSPGERILQAYDIYEAGYSNRIVMTDTYSPGSDALAESWYTDRESAKRVVMEYTRLLHFLIWERWKL